MRRAEDLRDILLDLKGKGYTLREMAEQLTARGILTCRSHLFVRVATIELTGSAV